MIVYDVRGRHTHYSREQPWFSWSWLIRWRCQWQDHFWHIRQREGGKATQAVCFLRSSQRLDVWVISNYSGIINSQLWQLHNSSCLRQPNCPNCGKLLLSLFYWDYVGCYWIQAQLCHGFNKCILYMQVKSIKNQINVRSSSSNNIQDQLCHGFSKCIVYMQV